MGKDTFTYALEKLIAQKKSRFYVPGHKGALPNFHPLAQAAIYDLTEIDGADSLYHADGILLDLENHIAKLYHSGTSLLSCGGSTLCIQTMLGLCAKEGQKVIMGRSVHHSALSAAALLGFNPIWIYPQADLGIWGRILPESIEEALKEHPDASAVYLTSPNYYGVCCDLPAISKICKTYKVPLLVDNAHGAHFPFTKGAIHPMDAGADFCADSAHKTLPALTGTAFLHCKSAEMRESAKQMMSNFGSTSPSYLMMLSADYALSYLENEGSGEYHALVDTVEHYKLIYKEKGYHFVEGNTDPIRLSISAGDLGYTGKEFAEYLRFHDIEPEMVGESFVVLVPTPFNTPEDFQRLSFALDKLPVKEEPVSIEILSFPPAEKVMGIREAFLLEGEFVDTEKSAGRIAAESKAPCPPGVPLIMAGERIEASHGEILKGYGISRIKVIK